jgi:hypothetical protein
MDDELKKAWQSQTAQPRLTLDAGLVLNEVRRNERQFAATIFCRDVREVGVALVLVPVWFYLGHKQSLPWSWYAVVPALFWIAGFMMIDRMRQRPHQPKPGDDLRTSIEKSLAQVEHQIWLLRNVLWWYLLPIYAGLLVWPAHHSWDTRDDGWQTLAEFAGITFTFTLVLGFIYWLNQYAVRKQLKPRRRELQMLLKSLDE